MLQQTGFLDQLTSYTSPVLLLQTGIRLASQLTGACPVLRPTGASPASQLTGASLVEQLTAGQLTGDRARGRSQTGLLTGIAGIKKEGETRHTIKSSF